MEKLAWFVSLIPFLPDAVLYSGTCDIWASSDLFLRMLGGDEEEHAVLLCNYFLFIGQEAWVVIGTAIPEGSTAYVLTHHPLAANKYILWDPSNGRYFTNTLSHIPLTSIACIFNNDNVWGNIQEFDHPSRVNFDLQSNKKWSPLFQANMAPLNSIQVETLEYPATDEIKVQQLQTRLDQLIHGHIEKLRVRHLTKWNRYCCRLLQNTLPMLEENPFFAKNTLQEHKKEICENFNGFQINGYPLHIRYTDISQLLGAIESTNIHSCGRDKTEFALSVYIHPYPNDVLSLWVYLAVMNPL
jgi:coiled-coil and C2 domain-containing protein 2A